MGKTWKSNELRIAKLFGTQRNPYSGSMSRQTSSDSLHEIFYLEMKDGKQSRPTNLWLDTVRKAKRENKIPMVIQHAKQEKILDARITMKLGDFLRLTGLSTKEAELQ